MSSVRETVRRLQGGGTGWTLLVVALGWLFVNGFRVVLPALLPQVKADFAIGNASAGFALTVLWGMYALLQFPGGVAADRLGERTLLVTGMVLGTLSLASFYVAPVFALFLLACAGFGIGAGLFGTPRDMFLSKTFPEADNTAYSAAFAAGSLGAAVLPVVATELAARAGWRAAIAALLPVFGLLAVVLWRVLPRRTADANGGGLSARATARRTFGALADRSVLLGSGGMILFIFTYQALVSFLPTYLVEAKGLDQGLAAALFGLMFVVGALLQPVIGHLADHYGERATMLGVVLLATGTLLALPFLDRGTVLLVLVPLLGVRIGIGPVTSAYVVRNLPVSVQGTGWGLLRTAFFGLGATGSSVVGVFADAGFFDLGFVVLAGLTAAIAPFWLLAPTTDRPEAPG